MSLQHIAGSNLKFTDYLSRNPVGGATPEEIYDEEYVINILTEDYRRSKIEHKKRTNFRQPIRMHENQN